MDRLLLVDPEQFVARMQAQVRKALEQVAAAVNGAPEGNVLSGSEMQVREVMLELQRQVYEAMVQMRIDSTESSFSPSKGRVGARQAEQGTSQPQHAERQRPDPAEPGPVVCRRGRQ